MNLETQEKESLLFVEVDINIKVDEFEGPIGLLLTLITKNKLSITRISLVEIVDQFIGFSKLHKPDLRTFAEFVRIVSILIYLKSVALSSKLQELDEEMEVETEDLLSRLEVLQRFREIKNFLKAKREERRRMLSKQVKRGIKRMKEYSVDELVRYVVKFLINLQEVKKYQLKRDEVSVSEKVEKVKAWLTTRDSFNFSDFVKFQPTVQVIASFMAILETTRSNITALHQKENFSDIIVLRKYSSS